MACVELCAGRDELLRRGRGAWRGELCVVGSVALADEACMLTGLRSGMRVFLSR